MQENQSRIVSLLQEVNLEWLELYELACLVLYCGAGKNCRMLYCHFLLVLLSTLCRFYYMFWQVNSMLIHSLFSCSASCSLISRAEFPSANAIMDGFGGADLTIPRLLNKQWS